MDTIKKCFDPKVLIGLGAVAASFLLFAPKFFFAALPLLLFAACPLSMAVMMFKMNKSSRSHGKTPK